MKIRKGGIYKTIDSKDFGIFQKSGWEKVVIEPLKELEITEEPMETIPDEAPLIEAGSGEIVEEQPVEEEIMPKAKKKKK